MNKLEPQAGRRAFLLALAAAGISWAATRSGLLDGARPETPRPDAPNAGPEPEILPEWQTACQVLGAERTLALAALAADLLPAGCFGFGDTLARIVQRDQARALTRAWEPHSHLMHIHREKLDTLKQVTGDAWHRLEGSRRARWLDQFFAGWKQAGESSAGGDEPDGRAALGEYAAWIRDDLEAVFWEQPEVLEKLGIG